MASKSMIRTRVKRSPVWAYFDEGPSSASTVTCKLCDGKLARQSGTTNLFNHLKSHHNDKYLEVVGAKPPCSGDASKTGAGTKPVSTFFSSELMRPCDKNRAGVITDCILDWIVDSIRPLSIGSDKGFVHLMQVCEPSYSVASRTYLTSLLDKISNMPFTFCRSIWDFFLHYILNPFYDNSIVKN